LKEIGDLMTEECKLPEHIVMWLEQQVHPQVREKILKSLKAEMIEKSCRPCEVSMNKYGDIHIHRDVFDRIFSERMK